jgi:hypothetical protein
MKNFSEDNGNVPPSAANAEDILTASMNLDPLRDKNKSSSNVAIPNNVSKMVQWNVLCVLEPSSAWHEGTQQAGSSQGSEERNDIRRRQEKKT